MMMMVMMMMMMMMMMMHIQIYDPDGKLVELNSYRIPFITLARPGRYIIIIRRQSEALTKAQPYYTPVPYHHHSYEIIVTAYASEPLMMAYRNIQLRTFGPLYQQMCERYLKVSNRHTYTIIYIVTPHSVLCLIIGVS
jgi:hypothetical protein